MTQKRFAALTDTERKVLLRLIAAERRRLSEYDLELRGVLDSAQKALYPRNTLETLESVSYGPCVTCGHIAQAHDLASKSRSMRVCTSDEYTPEVNSLYPEDGLYGYSCACVRYINPNEHRS